MKIDRAVRAVLSARVDRAAASAVALCLILAIGAATGANLSPVDLVDKSPKGSLKNPYTDAMPAVVARGEALFQSSSCSVCHGAKGGGGLCPPLTNDVWVYGGDDDTLFRLVTLGSDQLQKQGYTRTGHESMVASMPAFGGAIANADDLWAIITFIRSQYAGDPQKKFGAAPAQP